MLAIVRAAAPSELSFDDAVTWAGRAVDAEDAPLLEVRVAGDGSGEALRAALLAGDAIGVDAVVSSLAVPAGLLDAMARRCAEIDAERAREVATGRAGIDLRWRNAVSRAVGSSPDAAHAWIDPPVVFVPAQGMHVTHLRVLPDDRVAFLEQPLHGAKPRPETARLWVRSADENVLIAELAADRGRYLALLTPTARADASAIVLGDYDPEEHEAVVRRFSPDGSHVSSARMRAPSQPHQYSDVGDVRWIHCELHHVAHDGTRELCVLERGAEGPHGRAAFVGDWIAALSTPELVKGKGWISAELVWRDLAVRQPEVRVPFGVDKYRVCIGPEAVWVTAHGGVHRAVPGGGFERVFAEPAFGIDVGSNELLVGTGDTVVCVERTSGAERFRTKVGHAIYGVDRAPCGGCIVTSANRFTWVDDTGRVVRTSAERRDPAVAHLPDGTTAVSAGEEVLVIGRDASLRRHLMMSYDGQLVGATRDAFVFGPISGGIARTEPDALVAIDADGEVVSRVRLEAGGRARYRRPERTFYGGGSTTDSGAFAQRSVLLVDFAEWGLRTWQLDALATVDLEPTPSPVRSSRGVVAVKPHTYNPRDDFPEPGLDVCGGIFFGVDCKFGGTTGYCPAPAVRVDSGAVATLVRCTLVNGALVDVLRASTIVLIECDFEIDVESSGLTLPGGCHMILVDCRFTRPFAVHAMPGASIVTSGLRTVVQRADDAGITVLIVV